MDESTPQLNGKNSDKSLIGHVVSELGGVVFAVEAIDKTLSFASKAFPKNKFYQGTIKLFRGMTPVVLTSHKIYSSIKVYQEKKKQLSIRQKKSNLILNLMGESNVDEYDLDYYEFIIGKEVINWFVSSPKTEHFKILEFYNESFEAIPAKSLDKGECYILIEYDNNKYMIEAQIAVFNQQIQLSGCWIHTLTRYEKIKELKHIIFGEFINFFDTSNNIIEMSSKGLQTRKRMKLDFDIDQFDVNNFKIEILKAIEKNKKRGYVLVGPPGVGKSTVIIKLEHELPNIPIVYINSSGSTFREDVSNIFGFLRSISPCVCIFEDLDSYELTNKQDRIFSEFIEQMDGLKHDECVIIIATVNEPENIHPSLINRRGRFDKVYFVDFPKTEKQIIGVLKNKYKKEVKKDLPFEKLNESIISKIVKNNFSHADICEALEYLFINDINITIESFEKSVDGVIETMNAVNRYIIENDGNESSQEEIKNYQLREVKSLKYFN